MPRTWWIEIVKIHGLPTFMLLAIACGGWRAAEWSAENVIKPLVTRQIGLMDAIEKNISAQNATMSEVHLIVKHVAETNDSKLKVIADNQLALVKLIEEMKRNP